MIRIAIIGRPNVGKSTLFNRLLGRKRALVHNLPGVTRDRLEERAEWIVGGRTVPVALVDTGGLGEGPFGEEIRRQVGIALSEADVALVVFDGRAGLIPEDEALLAGLREGGVLKSIPTIGVVNKIDEDMHEALGAEFYAAGLDPLVTVSAEHGRGMDDVKAAVVSVAVSVSVPIPYENGTETETETETDSEIPSRGPPRIAIVGRPNVGKSTMTNALLGEHRMITSPIAGTTVDAIDSKVVLDGHEFVIVDTAGIRRKSKTEKGVEVLSVVQARKALERADVAILVIDGETGPVDQDEKIAGLIEDSGAGVVIAVNKWDTQRGKVGFDRAEAAKRIRKQMGFLGYAPILFTVARTGKGFDGLGELLADIMEQRRIQISTHEFSEWVRREAEVHNPRNARFYLSHQTGKNPPSFVCRVDNAEKVHFSLRRHLVNAIREKWGFMGSPVRLKIIDRQ